MKTVKDLNKDSKGQVQFIVAGILFVILVAIVAFGIALQNNFIAGTGQTPPFSTLWPQVVMGFALIGLMIGVVAIIRQQLG